MLFHIILHSENVVAAASPDYSTFPLTTLALRPAYIGINLT